jgi:hypothetical protein
LIIRLEIGPAEDAVEPAGDECIGDAPFENIMGVLLIDHWVSFPQTFSQRVESVAFAVLDRLIEEFIEHAESHLVIHH